MEKKHIKLLTNLPYYKNSMRRINYSRGIDLQTPRNPALNAVLQNVNSWYFMTRNCTADRLHTA
jgi:hypothetical protein